MEIALIVGIAGLSVMVAYMSDLNGLWKFRQIGGVQRLKLFFGVLIVAVPISIAVMQLPKALTSALLMMGVFVLELYTGKFVHASRSWYFLKLLSISFLAAFVYIATYSWLQ